MLNSIIQIYFPELNLRSDNAFVASIWYDQIFSYNVAHKMFYILASRFTENERNQNLLDKTKTEP